MIGLVLEGGGMRGLFTIGVLDCFMDVAITFPYCIGVSAGACNMLSYYSGQRGRNRRVNTDYVHDKRYMSWGNLIRTGSYFGEKMLFYDIPDELDPFDYDAYTRCGCQCYSTATSCKTGKAVFFPIRDFTVDRKFICASMSLPFISKGVTHEDDLLLDGGIADPIPAARALQDCEKTVVVLTRENGFRKEPENTMKLAGLFYRKYPELVKVLKRRHEIYNEELELIKKLEADGKVLVIRPDGPVDVGRTEKDQRKLDALYERGYAQAKKQVEEIRAFMK